MDKQEFRQLFLRNVRTALGIAEKNAGIPLSADFEIEFHGGGVSGEIISQDRAIDLLYLGANKFYAIVDIGVKYIDDNKARVFVRISAHQPVAFANTWNKPVGNGPFKILEPMGTIPRKPR